MSAAPRQTQISVDFENYSIRGRSTGDFWVITLFASGSQIGRDLIVSDGVIKDAKVTQMESGPPHVRAMNTRAIVSDAEGQAILTATERWQDFIVTDGND